MPGSDFGVSGGVFNRFSGILSPNPLVGFLAGHPGAQLNPVLR